MKRRYSLWPAALPVLALLWLLHVPAARSGAMAAGDGWLMGLDVKILVAGLAGAVAVGFLLFEKRRGRERDLARIYPVAGISLGLLYLVILPPLSAPDEISHYISAYQLSSHMLGEPSNGDDGSVLVRARDWLAEDTGGDFPVEVTGSGQLKRSDSAEAGQMGTVLGQTLTEETYRIIYGPDFGGFEESWLERLRMKAEEAESSRGGDHQNEGNRGGDHRAEGIRDGDIGEVLAEAPYPSVVTTPLAYVPQALGISLGRLLNLNCLGLLYLGRLFNLLFFVAMTWLAMRRLPFGGEVLFGVAMLPMTLHLSASFSYDVMIMACLFLFTAVCLDLAYAKEKAELKDILALAALMGVAGPCKMVYGIMMGLCLLVPVEKFGGRGRWLASAAAVAGTWVFAMAAVNGRVVAEYATVTDALVSGTNEAGFSLKLLFHHPGLLAGMFYNTFVHQMNEYHLTMIGARLGNLDPVLNVPYPAVILYTAGLLLLAFRKPGETVRVSGGRRVWVFAVCAACAGALMLSMLIACTPRTSTVIEGVQGRYFLPFLPVLLMACKNDWLVLTKNRNRSILFVMYCVNLYVVFRLFSVVCTRI